ncbi:MAG: DEAD/DEAH box helicase [Myxococcota bacterium]
MLRPPECFAPATRGWLARRFIAPTPVQQRGWPLLAEGRHALLVAPTGSGKTLAAFLAAIDRLGQQPADAPRGVRVLYVSPLKALVADIERNLRAPIAGIAEEAAAAAGAFRAPRVAVRTGDTSPRERRRAVRDPAEILVTTPESLYLILGSKARSTLETVETIIVDEIHALAGSKRGVHLALSLERVARRCRAGDPQRIGLSATARPVDAIARFLGGDRPVEIVDASAPPAIELEIRVPVPDMTRPDLAPPDASRPQAAPTPSLWSAIHPELLAEIRAHRSTIVFANSRALCERLAAALNDLAGEPLVRAHHGSLAHEKRREIESALAAGELRGIVATSSLELGIDMAAVERVLLVESPGAVARGLQRIGRAGHAVGETSRGVLFPKHRGDLLEAVVVALGMRAGEVESIALPQNALDVLAQQIVAIVAEGPIEVAALEALVRRCAGYAELDRKLLIAVLDMLSGRFPSADFAELRPRLHWDRTADRLVIRDGAGRIALLSGGTIPDRGQFAVHIAPDGPRIGELDEEMVHESKPGDVVTLGASSWRIAEIGRDRVLVLPAPGEAGRLPFWRGDGPGRPIELGRALGRFVRELSAQADPEAWLRAQALLDPFATANLLAHLAAQRAATGAAPSDREIVIERFRDELGDLRVAILSPFGARVHAPWALAITQRLAEWGIDEAHPLWTDDGILFRFADADEHPPLALLLPDPESLETLVCASLEDSALFATQFRENAARALLLPRRRAGARMPLWSQRLRSQSLHAVARRFPDFPILLETYRSCLKDVFDLPSLAALLRGIESGEIAVRDVETPSPSPFARSLVFAYTASFLYQPDLPAAERRSQALVLDRNLLRELLGGTDLRKLLDARALDETERSLQGLTPDTQARHADGLHDRLRRSGDANEAELAARFAGEPADYARARDALVRAGRIIEVALAGELRWIAVEDAAAYRDGLGVALPPGLPAALLEPAHAPLEQLVMRHARTHASFGTDALAARFGLRPAGLEPLLDSLARRGRLLAGEFDPRRQGREWCEPEVLRRVKQKTLARLREEIEPVPGEAVARFLLDWHGIAAPRRGRTQLDAVIDRLEGLPLSFAELERAILPARIADFDPALLDAAGSEGQLVWIGAGAIGERDGRIALHRRERLAGADPSAPGAPGKPGEANDPLTPIEARIHAGLERRGASFFSEIASEIRASDPGTPAPAIEAGLWGLVWRGLVTNDTFAPLRARRAPRAKRPRRPGRHAPPSSTAGRWSLVAPLLAANPGEADSPTERLHRRVLGLLDRHAIVSRESLDGESLPGGFSAIYPVLREMEEAGRIRRGHFSAGASSAQFALPGAVDRLRGFRARPAIPQAVLLASTDPAQPWGAQLPWPALAKGRARRAIGTAVVLVDGAPLLLVERGGRSLSLFVDPITRQDERLLAALRALAVGASRLGVKRLAVEQVDGSPARESTIAGLFERAGFRTAYRGFELDGVGRR